MKSRRIHKGAYGHETKTLKEWSHMLKLNVTLERKTGLGAYDYRSLDLENINLLEKRTYTMP